MKSISVIIPYYKGKEFICNNISQIEKSYSLSNKEFDYEIILIQDSFDDNEYLRNTFATNLHVKIFSNTKNIGVAETRNIGWKLAKGDFAMFIDQDDYVVDNYFNILELCLKSNRHITIFNGYIFDQKSNKKIQMYHIKQKFTLENILSKKMTLITPGIVVFNKKLIPIEDIFYTVSKYYPGSDDWAAYINLFIKIKDLNSEYFNYHILNYVKHDSNYSNNYYQMNKGSILLLNYYINKVAPNYLHLIKSGINFHYYLLFRQHYNITKSALLIKRPKYLFSFFFNRIRNFNNSVYRIKAFINNFLFSH